MGDDPRRDAARYRVDRLAEAEAGGGTAPESPETAAAPPPPPTPPPTRQQLRAMSEVAIEQAIRRGDFDDLPGAGKPLTGLSDVHDPDWWIRRKIESERLTGLGPPALTLRTESAGLQARLDALFREEEVRQVLDDFNRRVVEARRQLQGGPPVVTPTRDVDAEVAAWRDRRDQARVAATERARAEQAAQAALTWRERRRARTEAARRSPPNSG